MEDCPHYQCPECNCIVPFSAFRGPSSQGHKEGCSIGAKILKISEINREIYRVRRGLPPLTDAERDALVREKVALRDSLPVFKICED